MTSVALVCTSAPADSATRRARSASTSKTAPTRVPDTAPASRRTCSVPMLPVPMTPTVMSTLVSFLPLRRVPAVAGGAAGAVRDAQLLYLVAEDVRRLGRRSAAGLQLVAELFQLGAAGHHRG